MLEKRVCGKNGLCFFAIFSYHKTNMIFVHKDALVSHLSYLQPPNPLQKRLRSTMHCVCMRKFFPLRLLHCTPPANPTI